MICTHQHLSVRWDSTEGQALTLAEVIPQGWLPWTTTLHVHNGTILPDRFWTRISENNTHVSALPGSLHQSGSLLGSISDGNVFCSVIRASSYPSWRVLTGNFTFPVTQGPQSQFGSGFNNRRCTHMLITHLPCPLLLLGDSCDT